MCGGEALMKKVEADWRGACDAKAACEVCVAAPGQHPVLERRHLCAGCLFRGVRR